MKALRILLASDHYPPFIGGAHRQTQLLGRYLASRGHAVQVVTPRQAGIPDAEIQDAVAISRIPQLRTPAQSLSGSDRQRHQPPFVDPVTVYSLRRVIARFRPDIVHSYGWITYSVAGALAGSQTPLVLSARDYAYSCPTRTLLRDGSACSGPGLAKCIACSARHYGVAKGSIAALSVRSAAPSLRRRIDGIHSVSNFVQSVMERDFLRGLPGAEAMPLAVIPSFMEAQSSEPTAGAAEVNSALGPLATRPPFMLFVGALRREKGVHDLVEAYRGLQRAPELLLVGTVERDSPTALPRGVTVIAGARHPIVMGLWDRCLFGVLPSRWPEPLGSVVYEGMSQGKAVIGTHPGGHTDMIDDGRTGLLVPSGDIPALRRAMQRLVDDSALRSRLGGAARVRAAVFTNETALPLFEDLYHRAIERRRQVPAGTKA